jgi:hypothetical protein
MLSQPLPENTSTVVLDADQKAVVVKEISEIIGGLSYVAQLVEKDSLQFSLGQNVLRIAEDGLANLSKVTKIDTDGLAEREQRYGMLRAANARIRVLEQQMGEAVGAVHIQMGIQEFGKKLDSWWDLEGFGHISDMNFTKHGHCEVMFSCMLFGTFSLTGSQKPVSDKGRFALWRESLQERGFVLKDDPREKDSVVDCDASRQTLCKLFADRLPSSQVIEINNHGNRDGVFTMRDVKVFIRNLEDIMNLPQGPQAE